MDIEKQGFIMKANLKNIEPWMYATNKKITTISKKVKLYHIF